MVYPVLLLCPSSSKLILAETQALLQRSWWWWDLTEGVNLTPSWVHMHRVMSMAFQLASASQWESWWGREQTNAQPVSSHTTPVAITSWRRHTRAAACRKATRNAGVLQPHARYSQVCKTKHPRGPYCKKKNPTWECPPRWDEHYCVCSEPLPQHPSLPSFSEPPHFQYMKIFHGLKSTGQGHPDQHQSSAALCSLWVNTVLKCSFSAWLQHPDSTPRHWMTC